MSRIHDIAQQMVAKGKGVLAIDESHGTCAKRFEALGVACDESSRQAYRQLLVTAPGAEEYISGMILFDETLRQSTDGGVRSQKSSKTKELSRELRSTQGQKILP